MKIKNSEIENIYHDLPKTTSSSDRCGTIFDRLVFEHQINVNQIDKKFHKRNIKRAIDKLVSLKKDKKSKDLEDWRNLVCVDISDCTTPSKDGATAAAAASTTPVLEAEGARRDLAGELRGSTAAGGRPPKRLRNVVNILYIG